MIHRCLVVMAAAILAAGYAQEAPRVQGKNIRIEFDAKMHSRVVALFDGRERVVGDFTPSTLIRLAGNEVSDFVIQDVKKAGSVTTLTGSAPSLKIVERVTVRDDAPRMAFFDVEYTNMGKTDLQVSGWTNQHYSIAADSSAGQPEFWSYQSGSY